ncbi:MAG: NAD(P)-binding domain-containing protein, partial [Burkholderiales bacterium]
MKAGFIGLGVMGAHMAANLARAGHEVAGNDLRKVEVEGVRWAATAVEAAADADVVFTSLPGPKEVEALAPRLGDALPKGAAWFDLTTNSPACVRRVHAQLRSLGVEFLDAPVSGGMAGARSGRLAIWVGGDEATYRRFEPLLRALELVEGGLSLDEIALVAKAIEKAGASILNTGIGWHEARIPTIAQAVPRGAFAWATRNLKQAVKIP